MLHLVEYEKYCKTCEHAGTDETKDPCNDCLTYPVNDDSRKPIHYKEATEKKQNRRNKNVYKQKR